MLQEQVNREEIGMNPAQFVSKLQEKGIQLSEKQQKQFTKYYQILVKWNEKMNLTGLTEEQDVYLKHFYDSISLAFYVNFEEVESICDVGSGAGFPSIPLKICFPHIKVTIIDSLQKRIRFLEHLAKELSLDDVSFIHSRAEDAGQNKRFREAFDVVTARAVARMSVLSELCLPFVQKKGIFAAMKGANIDDELEQGKKAIQTLGGNIQDVHSFSLPIEESERTIVIIEKQKNTPKKYPRKAGTPNRQPIKR